MCLRRAAAGRRRCRRRRSARAARRSRGAHAARSRSRRRRCRRSPRTRARRRAPRAADRSRGTVSASTSERARASPTSRKPAARRESRRFVPRRPRARRPVRTQQAPTAAPISPGWSSPTITGRRPSTKAKNATRDDAVHREERGIEPAQVARADERVLVEEQAADDRGRRASRGRRGQAEPGRDEQDDRRAGATSGRRRTRRASPNRVAHECRPCSRSTSASKSA